MTFRVGQEVVLVDDKFPPLKDTNYREYPVRDKIYTISEIMEGGSLILKGLPRLLRHRRGRAGFWQDRFRPVVKTKTSIAIFKKMLTPSPTTIKQQEPVEI